MYEFSVATAEQLIEVYKLRYEVYCLEKSWISPDGCSDRLEKDEYDSHAQQFVAVATSPENGKVVACFRLICANEAGFPCEKHFDLTTKTDPLKTVELSRLIVAKEHRASSKEIIKGFCREIYIFNTQNGIRWCYAAVDPPLYLMVKRMGIPFERIGERGSYMGDTIPIMLDMECVEQVMPSCSPEFYELITGGKTKVHNRQTFGSEVHDGYVQP